MYAVIQSWRFWIKASNVCTRFQILPLRFFLYRSNHDFLLGVFIFFCVVGLQWVLIKPPTHLDVHAQIASIHPFSVCQWVKGFGVVLSALKASPTKQIFALGAFGGQKRDVSEISRCDPQRTCIFVFFLLFICSHKGLKSQLHQTQISSAHTEQLKQQHQLLKVSWKYPTSD